MEQSPKVSLEERISRYLQAMEAPRRDPGDPQDSHKVVFNAARALLHGFGLSPEEARPFLEVYLQRSDLPWAPAEISHKLRQVDAQQSKWPRGYLRRTDDWKPSGQVRKAMGIPTEQEVRKKVEFDHDRLKRLAARWRDTVTGEWLANRSSVDPATVTAEKFLQMLYPNGEKILVFENEYSQGEALWPVDPVPTDGRVGIWYLPQPVSGEYQPNPEGKPGPNGEDPKPSRRIWRCVESFRYFVLESDEAPMMEWLGWIVQVPLRIEALYTSGSRSIHALIRVNARTKDEWDEIKRRMMPFLVASLMCGADRGTWSAVRLSRLPGCLRRGKMGVLKTPEGEPRKDDQGRPMKRYQQYTVPGEQKLLYFRPGADPRPICERPVERDVVGDWCAAANRFFDGHESPPVGDLIRGLTYYQKSSEACAAALRSIQETQ